MMKWLIDSLKAWNRQQAVGNSLDILYNDFIGIIFQKNFTGSNLIIRTIEGSGQIGYKSNN